MGPVVIFDKSFLQSLSLDESVWLDNFFISNICPVLFSETLSDLNKPVRSSRTPEQEVRIIANKTPEMSIAINTFHRNLCFANLHGYNVIMDGRPVISGGKPVESEGRKGFVFEPPPEAVAFERWKNEDFLFLEREYAKNWRDYVNKIDFEFISSCIERFGIQIPKCKTLMDAKIKAEEILEAHRHPLDTMKLIFTLINAQPEDFLQIYFRWGQSKFLPIKTYFPYVYHVLTIELFFYISIASGLISPERKSNKIDISYLFYLPFCNIFISSDKLHKRSASIFINKQQEFIWGPDLKDDLRKLNEHYGSFPEEIKHLGLHSFAAYPPTQETFLVTRLWDTYLPNWRNNNTNQISLPKHINNTNLPESIKKFVNGNELKDEEVDFDIDNADAMALKRVIQRKKGNWYQIGKHIEIEN